MWDGSQHGESQLTSSVAFNFAYQWSWSTLWCRRSFYQPRQPGTTDPSISKTLIWGSVFHRLLLARITSPWQLLSPDWQVKYPNLCLSMDSHKSRIHLSCWVWRLQRRFSPAHLLQWFQESGAILIGTVTNFWCDNHWCNPFFSQVLNPKPAQPAVCTCAGCEKRKGILWSAPTRLTASASAKYQHLLLQLVCISGCKHWSWRCSGTKQLISKYFMWTTSLPHHNHGMHVCVANGRI